MSVAAEWLEPLRSSLPELDSTAWDSLRWLATELADQAGDAPPAEDRAGRSRWLLGLRRRLAEHGHRAPADPAAAAVWQTLAQFCAGLHDLDLRDATGPGHGAMILTGAAQPTVDIWRCRLDEGDLVGIAATERHGGSRIQEITTRARLHRDGRWRISGEKCWVSRLVESAGFVVFFRDPDSRITAAVIDAADHGLEREVVEPFGLSGWSWAVLRLHDVPVHPATELVGLAGTGLDVFRRHFARFRPLVAATALGTAAGVHTLVADTLAARRRAGVLPRVRDNALITLGRTHAEITVDTAHRAVTDLAPLLGACGYRQASPIAKARADLTGMLYADGVHDSLYRSGGISLLDRCTALSPRHRASAEAPSSSDS